MDMDMNLNQRLSSMQDLSDLLGPLSDLKNDIENCQVRIDKESRNRTAETHMQAVFALSNLEVKMTNFANGMREKFS